jgi:hypothetical protein
MKSSIKKLFSLLVVAVLFTSCNVNMFNRISGNNNVTSNDRSTKESFTKVKVSSGLDLYLEQGSKNTVTVEADENLQDIIITEVKDGVLKIYTEKNIWRAKSRKVYVTIKTLEAITATSGADVYATKTITSNDLKVSSTSGADIRIDVDAENVETSSNSGSDIEITGIATNHKTSASSGASIDAYNLKSKNVTANVSSGADINVFASESINARASSGGDIDFKGRPAEVKKKSNSGGSISQK